MLKTNRFLYVGFMCHQVIEKILKACYTFLNDDMPPYTHNLRYLAEKSLLLDQFSEKQKSFLNESHNKNRFV